MTPPRPRGGLRSMGASLLDQVLAETVDPAYARAAAARAEREAAAAAAGEAPEAVAARRRRAGRRSSLLTASVLVVAGLLAVVTYDVAAASAPRRQEVRAALISDIDAGSATVDDLQAQLTDLTAQVDAARDSALRASALGQEVLARLARAQAAAGTVAVSGPGLRVTLADAPPTADSDPVGGAPAKDPAGDVQDRDLQSVVNALWAAGAEAISINGQRLGPTSAIRFAGEAVLVDLRPVASPYEVSAVGDPDAMAPAFLNSPEVGFLAVVSETTGLRFEYSREDDLQLPAGTVPELRSAAPLLPPGDAAGDAAATDPTPGG